MINYDTAATDSTTHYLLGGLDHHLTEHLTFHVLGGGSVRSLENAGESTNPYFESSVGYGSSNHSLSWTTSYDFEAANQAGVSVRKTLRTGLTLNYGLTSRINSTTGVYFHHDDDQGLGTQDSLDLSVGLRYLINKHFTFRVDYAYSTQSSLGPNPGYSRNRWSAGLTYTY
jgi:hypothetical protein